VTEENKVPAENKEIQRDAQPAFTGGSTPLEPWMSRRGGGSPRIDSKGIMDGGRGQGRRIAVLLVSRR
jgi:hypothetical protein